MANAGYGKQALELATLATYYTPEEIRDEVQCATALYRARQNDWKGVREAFNSIKDPIFKIQVLAGFKYPQALDFEVYGTQQAGLAVFKHQAGDQAGAVQAPE